MENEENIQMLFQFLTLVSLMGRVVWLLIVFDIQSAIYHTEDLAKYIQNFLNDGSKGLVYFH